MKTLLTLLPIATSCLLSCSCEREADAANTTAGASTPPAEPSAKEVIDPESSNANTTPPGAANSDTAQTPPNTAAMPERETYKPETEEELKARLTPLQYEVTKLEATERPWTNKFDKHFEQGIYVCIISGEPLFSSKDKYDSGCGWPAFTKPIDEQEIEERTDYKIGYARTEVRAKTGDSHLGHVFNDGPPDAGGMRYCINSASLRFVPKDKLVEEGYGKYLKLFEADS